MSVFEMVKNAREIKGLTQEDMADALGISSSGYSKMERGETRISIDRLQKIADILEMDIYELIPPKEHNVICELNGGYHFHGTYYHNQDSQSEIEKLKLIIAHKDELIAQKDNELKTLRNLFSVLQEQLSKF